MTGDPIIIALVEHRKYLGLSQRAVARRIGTSVSNVHYWESGEHDPSLTNLRAWATALGYAVALL